MMSITTSKPDDGKDLIIKVGGKFDFSLHNEFRKSYKDETVTGEYHVDLSDTEYLDSSALGMLLLLKEHAESVSSSVKIINAGSDIKEILVIASFDKLFTIA
jgi:HptB-dependent secretion and biofilm anti anti-sigma factor